MIPNPASERTIALWLFLLLLASSLCLFSGRFHSIDEVSSVALADTLLTRGQAHTDQIAWSQSWPLPQGAYGQDGHLYSKKGIGLSLVVAPLQAAARWLPGVGVVGMAMLSNGWITALTGALLYLLARRLAYARPTALFVTLGWAFGTFALVYSKSLFNSSAVALAFVAALLLLADPPRGLRRRSGATVLAGAMLGWALLTRAENALVIPLFAAFVYFMSSGNARARLADVTLFGLPVVLVVAFLLWFNLARFGNPLDFGYNLNEEANGNIAVGLVGLFFSPGRSLLLYMPMLLPALWGLFSLRGTSERPRRALAWLILGLTIVYALFFARSADWWGGWNWGVRYFLPLLPLWCLGLAPLWERGRWRAAMIGLVTLSALLQVPGALVDFNRPLLQAVRDEVPLAAQLWGVRDSQLVAHLRLLPDWQAWDVVWAATGHWELLVGGLALLAATILGLQRATRGRATVGGGAAVALGLLLLVLLTQRAAYRDPAWQAHGGDLAPLVARLGDAPSRTVLLFEMLSYKPYFDRAQAWLNLNRSGVPHVQLLQQARPDATQRALLERATRDAQVIFLATEGTPPGDENSGSERWLSERAFLVESEWLGPDTRLSHFLVGGDLQPASAAVPLEDGITLEAADHNAVTAPLRPGEALRLALRWRAEGAPTADYTVFVQLLGPGGVVAQSDGWPQAGFAPTSTWQAGQPIEERRALLLPPDLAPGDYALVAGLYDSAGRRLPLLAGGDTVPLGQVRVRQ